MSKARTKSLQQKKQKGQRGKKEQQANRLWLWGAVVVLPLLLIGTLLTFAGQPSAAETEISALPAATLPDEIAEAVAAAEQSTAATATTRLGTTADGPTLQPGPADACRRHPRFARQLGFNERSFLSTSTPSIKGLVMIQPAEGTAPGRIHQDPTWDDAGYLGHMTFDQVGNVYLFPSPRVSLVDNPPEHQNTLYRVDTDSGAMSPWLPLTTDAAPSAANPYGLMGTTYDCDTQSLYASTVAGSTAGEEIGKIVRIDITAAAVVAELQGIDPFGLSVYNEANPTDGTVTDGAVTKRLYFGAARAPEVYSVPLDAAGDFAGQPQLELALPDPTLKPWRIVWDTNGDLVVRAVPFDFNLIATSERIEIPFRFRRDEAGLWQLLEG